MEFVIGQLLGFGIGILSSGAFLYLLSFSRPNLAISPEVAHDEANNELHIRLLNKGRRFVSDVNVVLFAAEETQEGRLIRLFEPALNVQPNFVLSPVQHWRKKWTLPTATTIKAKDADRILALLSENPSADRRIVLTITGIDAITSSKAIIRKTFELAQIKKGTFVPYTINKIQLSSSAKAEASTVRPK